MFFHMSITILFFINSALLGVGLAMDAFSVSLANGLNEPFMRRKKMIYIAGVYGFFQGLMPMTGWVCVHTVIRFFKAFERFIPWIALILLVYIGVSMILDSRKENDHAENSSRLDAKTLLLQGIATSIDALSVGFTIAEYPLPMALTSSLIIAFVTFIICILGLQLGKRFGLRLAGKASMIGGIILIGIGLEIFLKSILTGVY